MDSYSKRNSHNFIVVEAALAELGYPVRRMLLVEVIGPP